MKPCQAVVFLVILCLCPGNGNARSLKKKVVLSTQHKIVRKQQVPSHIRKQYIDTYGGNSVMGGSPIMASDQGIGETDQSFIETTENGQQTQNNMANTLQAAGISLNSGLTQNSMDENRVQTMSSDLVESTEGTDSRQLIGNGLMQGGGGGLDISPPGGTTNLETSLGGGLDGGLGASIGGAGLGGSLGGGLGASLDSGTNLGIGGGTVEVGGGNEGQGIGALNDGLGADGGGDFGMTNGGGLGGSIGATGISGGSNIEGIGGGSLSDSGINGGLGVGGIGGSNIGGGAYSDGVDNLGDGGIGDLGGNMGGGYGQISDGLAGLGGNGAGSFSDGLGLEALGSRIAAGSKAQNFGPLGGAHNLPAFPGLGSNGGLLGGMSSDHQVPLDMQLSDAADENPAMIHGGLAPILPGKTVHAHVSDKPTGNRPAIMGPSMNAALQVQEQAKKQHQERLVALKLKLKKLREKLEVLQQNTGNKQTKISSKQKENMNNEEIDTLNELRMATQDAIKELHTDYPHAKKKQETAQPKHESLGSKLKTVDFTAKETGDTLEELLKLLDPELQDKKRGEVHKMNATAYLGDEAESKLATLTKKAEDEVDMLASQSPKPKTVLQANSTARNENSAKTNNKKPPNAGKGLSKHGDKDKTKLAPIKKGKMRSTEKFKKIPKYRSLGCWRDDPDRVVPSLENTSTLLQDGYRLRQDSVKKCAQVANKQGFAGFGIENGGQCFGGQNLLIRYKKYGRSKDCGSNGTGGDYAMEVYTFQ